MWIELARCRFNPMKSVICRDAGATAFGDWLKIYATDGVAELESGTNEGLDQMMSVNATTRRRIGNMSLRHRRMLGIFRWFFSARLSFQGA